MHTAFWVLAYFATGFFIWYVAYGFDAYMTGAKHVLGRFWLFKHLWNELKMFSPGGFKRRTDSIRKRVEGQPYGCGSICGRSYQEIRDGNLYEDVAREYFGNGTSFWLVQVLLYFFLWPLTLILVIASIAWSQLWYSIAIATKKMRI